MSVIGGDILEVTFNHPTLGSGIIFPKAAEDSTFDPGGFRSNDDDGMIDGSGQMIDELTRIRWSLESTIAWDMNSREDLTKLVALNSDPVLAEWTFTHINGTVWGGQGKPVGDMKGNGKAATFPLKIAGGGVLQKIIG